MKTVTRYEASDGSIWSSVRDAEFRERLIEDVKAAMSGLKPYPSESNWNGYVQQCPNAVQLCKEKLHRIANVEGVLKWWFDSQKVDHGKTDKDLIACHPSWPARMLEGSHGPLSSAYHRLMRIDDSSREWNQPYYADNPGTGKDVCVG